MVLIFHPSNLIGFLLILMKTYQIGRKVSIINIPQFFIASSLAELHVCPECKVSFANSKYLKNHMKRKCVRRRNKEANEYECGHCSHSFKLMSQLTQHMSLHTNGKPFKCQHCDKSFLTKGNLKRHGVIHEEAGMLFINFSYIFEFNV